MKPSRHRLIRRLFVLAVLAFVTTGLLGPSVFGPRISLHTGYAEAANRHTVTVDSATMLFDRPLLVLERGTVSLVPANDRALNDAEIDRVLHDGSAELVIEEAKFLLDETGLNPARVSKIDEAIKPIVEAITALNFAKLHVKDTKLVSRPAAPKDQETLLGHVTCEITKSSHGITAKGSLERDGVSMPFDLTLNTKTAHTAAGRLPITLKIASDLLTASLTGDYIRGENFAISATQATLASPHAKNLIRWLSGASVTGNGLEDFRASGPVEWSSQTFTFQDAKFSIDGNTASGGLSLSVEGDRPMLDATLAFDNLELAPYVHRPSGALAGLTQDALNWSLWLIGEPSSGSLIRDVDADLRLSAASVTSEGASLGHGAASITVKNGKLLADLAEIELDREALGNARLAIDLSGPTPRYELHGMIETPDLANVTGIVTDRQIVSGAGRIDLDFAASGNSRDEFRQSFAGTAAVTMPGGGRVAVDIPSLMAAGKSGGLGWDHVANGSTNLEALDAKLEAANGVVTATKIQAQTESRTLDIGGSIDLSKQMVDLSVAASPKDGASVPAAERIRIRGPLLAPAIRTDPPSKAALNLPNELASDR